MSGAYGYAPGSRREKIAGYLKAANELRQSYASAHREGDMQDEMVDDNADGMPGAFPEVKVARGNGEEMLLFPTYARRHQQKDRKPPARNPMDGSSTQAMNDADYWRREWEIFEDQNAVVDVDIRGWIYSPQRGPMNRKNRLLVGIARQLSGIPAPTTSGSRPSSRPPSPSRTTHEEEMAEREARKLLRRGQAEADAAGRGLYSEKPGDWTGRPGSKSETSLSRDSSPSSLSRNPTSSGIEPEIGGLKKSSSWKIPEHMSSEELATANQSLLNRLKPFMTVPSVGQTLTVFYYNDDTSQSRTTTTDDSGHFDFRAALNFVPTSVKVLTASGLSASEPVFITEPRGISLISDVDDTIKHSAISAGAREIFRNTFVRDLADLKIDGVRNWYTRMYDLGVKLHYVSNSPWQLYPVLKAFFAKAGLPPGSFHLKQYTGMLQGIFEPVAERKKGTLERILNDFPERRFILVGDSGEADLEVYTDVVLAHPRRILGVFIRDITTRTPKNFFDTSLGPLSGNGGSNAQTPSTRSFNGHAQPRSVSPAPNVRPALPARPMSTAAIQQEEPEDLITFSDDEEGTSKQLGYEETPPKPGRKPSLGPPPPLKPFALRSKQTIPDTTVDGALDSPRLASRPSAPELGSRFATNSTAPAVTSPLSQILSPSSISPASPLTISQSRLGIRNKVSIAYNSLHSTAGYINGDNVTAPAQQPRSVRANNPSNPTPPLPPRRDLSSYPAAAAQYASSRIWGAPNGGEDSGHSSKVPQNAIDDVSASNDDTTTPLSKKQELWTRRWAKSKEVLDSRGVMLRAWRAGNDVKADCEKLVEEEMDREEKRQRGKR